jgi:hypothetical protein
MCREPSASQLSIAISRETLMRWRESPNHLWQWKLTTHSSLSLLLSQWVHHHHRETSLSSSLLGFLQTICRVGVVRGMEASPGSMSESVEEVTVEEAWCHGSGIGQRKEWRRAGEKSKSHPSKREREQGPFSHAPRQSLFHCYCCLRERSQVDIMLQYVWTTDTSTSGPLV